ncbi:IS200/IS605 family transposase [Membranihabitans marinus]|uniref:IS200/IS605 family transposase n=1 Tax=Membranihabitans marinus TaxID=1227546 RepID=UPI001F030F34|nr:IS200/IS605 family transposase [Membranihabitans marinus]
MRSGTFTQLYIHLIFAVKHRQNLILNYWEEELKKYITGIINVKGEKLLAINNVKDHIHILIRIRPSCCLSDLVREIKKSSNAWINKNRFVKGKFEWQEGYGAFSCSHYSIDNVINYIEQQKEHHKRISFKEEYITFLKNNNIEFDDSHLFNWVE